MSEFQFRRVRLEGTTLKLTREEWDQIEIALGAATGPSVTSVCLIRDTYGSIVTVATIGVEGAKE